MSVTLINTQVEPKVLPFGNIIFCKGMLLCLNEEGNNRAIPEKEWANRIVLDGVQVKYPDDEKRLAYTEYDIAKTDYGFAVSRIDFLKRKIKGAYQSIWIRVYKNPADAVECFQAVSQTTYSGPSIL